MFCKKNYIIIVLILLSSSIWAYKNDPVEFRGIKWGTFIDSLNNMEKSFIEDDLHSYVKENDKQTIGEAQLKSIHYVFWEKKFIAVSISGEGMSNFLNLKKAVFKSFGAGFQFNEYIQEYQWGIGKFDTTYIVLEFNEINESFTLLMYKKQSWLERDNAKDIKAEDAINDF